MMKDISDDKSRASGLMNFYKICLILTASILLVSAASAQITQKKGPDGSLVFEDGSSNELLNISKSGGLTISGSGSFDMPNGIVIGNSAESTDNVSVAIGKNAYAVGGATGAGTAVGLDANASKAGNSAFGDEAEATADFASAFGGGSEATGVRSTALGILSNATDQYATSVGMYSWTKKVAGTSLGYNSQTWDEFGTSVGVEAMAKGYSSTVLGAQSNATGERSAVFGSIADASNRASAFGSEATANTNYSVALGQLSTTSGPGAGGIAIGRDALAEGSGVAIGEEAYAGENRTVVFGGGIYDYDVDVTGNASIQGSYAEIRGDSSGDPVLDYRLQEGDDYGAFVKYDSQFGGDTSDNRLVIGTEDSGTDMAGLTVNRSTSNVEVPNGNLSLAGNDINDVGTLNANTKNFVQQINETHEIVYTSSESGEVVVEWSDSVIADSSGIEIDFPDHLQEVMSSKEDYHVLTTSVDSLANTGVFDKTDSGFTLKASEPTEVDFHVRGVREGYEDKEVVREK